MNRIVMGLSYLLLAANVYAINITSNNVVAIANDRIGVAGTDTFSGTTVPSISSIEAVDSGNGSRVDIDYSVSANLSTFSHSFSLRRGGGLQETSQAIVNMYFTADLNDTFFIDGFFGVTHMDSPGEVYYRSTLEDLTTGTLLFDSLQVSRNTVDEFLDLGALGGDSTNSFSGSVSSSLSGDLINGHQYRWFSNASIYGFPDADQGAVGSGQVTMRVISEEAAHGVSDGGSTITLAYLALLFLFAFRRKIL